MRLIERVSNARADLSCEGLRPMYLVVNPSDFETIRDMFGAYHFHAEPVKPGQGVYFLGMQVVVLPGHGDPTPVPAPSEAVMLESIRKPNLRRIECQS